MSDESPVRRRLSGAQILVEWWDTPTPEYHPEQHARWLAGGDPSRRSGDTAIGPSTSTSRTWPPDRWRTAA